MSRSFWSSLAVSAIAVLFWRTYFIERPLRQENAELKQQLETPAPIKLAELPAGEYKRVDGEKRVALVEAYLGTVPRSPRGTVVAVYCNNLAIPERFEISEATVNKTANSLTEDEYFKRVP